MDASHFRIELAQHKRVLVAKPVGWIHPSDHVQLEEELSRLVARGHRFIVIDLSASHLVNSTSLGVFLYYKNMLDDEDGCLVLAAPSETMQRMIASAHLQDALDIFPTRAEAIEFARQRTGSGKWEPVEV